LRGYGKEGVVEAIRAAGGEVYAITSEPQTLARNAQDDWETGFQHVGDPHQEIASTCAQRGWLSLFTNDWGPDIIGTAPAWLSHPNGYFQPGVLALGRGGRVLYRWRCRPDRSNVGGAVARPVPGHVWRRVQEALAQGPDAADVAHDDAPELDSPRIPWPFFVMLLLANGWFLRPVPFDQRSGRDTAWRRQRNAMLRMAGFAAGWIAAAVFLPLWVVAVAFAAWLAKVGPGIRLVNERFQNVRPDEEPVWSQQTG
jgi:hypothetical protein